jgi:DNA-nicking Smr family endonuclease
MPGRRLGPDEQALWNRVARSVRPLARDRPATATPTSTAPIPSPQQRRAEPPSAVPRPPAAARSPGGTLDGSWDHALRRGGVVPDRVIDLHGHTLAAAHAALDLGLEQALAEGARVILLITGRAPREGGRRGIIHASFRDWLTASRHARRIAAVRPAHARHGGTGAFYVVLRRSRAKS